MYYSFAGALSTGLSQRLVQSTLAARPPEQARYFRQASEKTHASSPNGEVRLGRAAAIEFFPGRSYAVNLMQPQKRGRGDILRLAASKAEGHRIASGFVVGSLGS
jgi:hypothetical protein